MGNHLKYEISSKLLNAFHFKQTNVAWWYLKWLHWRKFLLTKVYVQHIGLCSLYENVFATAQSFTHVWNGVNNKRPQSFSQILEVKPDCNLTLTVHATSCRVSNTCTPPLYNTIVGVQPIFRVSYPNHVISRVKCICYIGKGVLNSHLRSKPEPCYIQNCVIMNRVIKRFRCTSKCCCQSLILDFLFLSFCCFFLCFFLNRL